MTTTVPATPTRPTTAQSTTSSPEPTFEELAARVDAAFAAVEALEPAARKVATELRSALEAVHRAGLVAIVRRLKGEQGDDSTRQALYDLVDEPVVHMLLSLHGIIRPDPRRAADRALAAVRPQLQSHGGDVTLVKLEDATAYVRLEGACNGCSMSSVTLRNLVESALLDGVPGLRAVEVLPNEPGPALIPLEALRIGRDPEAEGWVRAGAAAEYEAGRLHRVELIVPSDGSTVEAIVVNLDNRLSAFRNECAHEALPLDAAVLDVSNGTLTCRWHGFCYDASSGECLSAPGAQLEQLPMRVDDGQVWIRVGT